MLGGDDAALVGNGEHPHEPCPEAGFLPRGGKRCGQGLGSRWQESRRRAAANSFRWVLCAAGALWILVSGKAWKRRAGLGLLGGEYPGIGRSGIFDTGRA